MCDYLNELERLAKRHSAKVTLTMEGQTIRATCKMPGMSKETVVDYRSPAYNYSPPEGVNGVLHTLVVRLGYRHVPTTARLLDLLTTAQRQRVTVLLDEFKQIRDTALGRTARAEPRLTSPRSSLHPAFLDGERE